MIILNQPIITLHAVELAHTPDARDAQILERLFAELAVKFGCGGTTCYETQAAKDVERVVLEELKTRRVRGISVSGTSCLGRFEPQPGLSSA
jgi:hypothetical protein